MGSKKNEDLDLAWDELDDEKTSSSRQPAAWDEPSTEDESSRTTRMVDSRAFFDELRALSASATDHPAEESPKTKLALVKPPARKETPAGTPAQPHAPSEVRPAARPPVRGSGAGFALPPWISRPKKPSAQRPAEAKQTVRPPATLHDAKTKPPPAAEDPNLEGLDVRPTPLPGPHAFGEDEIPVARSTQRWPPEIPSVPPPPFDFDEPPLEGLDETPTPVPMSSPPPPRARPRPTAQWPPERFDEEDDESDVDVSLRVDAGDSTIVVEEIALSAEDREAIESSDGDRMADEVDLGPVRAKFERGDYLGVLIKAEAILEEHPDHGPALRYVESAQELMNQRYLDRIGAEVPHVVVQLDALEQSIDSRAAFLVSLIDGLCTVDQILDMSGMASLDALRLLYELRERGIIVVAS